MKASELSEYITAVRDGSIDLRGYQERLMKKLHDQNSRLELFSKLYEKPGGKNAGTLAALPFSVKDNICVKDFLTRAGSKILIGYRPPFNATVVERMREAGAAFIGTTNMDEFGFGTFSTNCAFGTPRNPFDDSRSCGGSSGGAAGSTAILKHHVALGESTGGSISCPAAFCGVIGLTPTYGRVSRYGLIDYANSLDKIGIMARAIDDISLVLPVIAGRDRKDPTSMVQPPLSLDGKKIKRIAVPEELSREVSDERIISMFWKSIDRIGDEGIEVEKIKMPILEFSIPAYYILASAEASTNLAKFSGMRYGKEGSHFENMYNTFFTEVRTEAFGVEAKRRIMLGTFARMVGYRDKYYMKALMVRRKIVEEFERVFRDFDLVASPTMPLLPPEFEKIEEMSPASIYALDFLTVPPNLAGLPHISMPMGYIDDLPAGIHFIAPHWEEGRLITIGRVWEQEMEYRFPMSLEGLN